MTNRTRATLFWITLPVFLMFCIFGFIGNLIEATGNFLQYHVSSFFNQIDFFFKNIHENIICGGKTNRLEVRKITRKDYERCKSLFLRGNTKIKIDK